MPDAATIKPKYREFQILPNGNLVESELEGHGPLNGGTGIQVLEFNPAGESSGAQAGSRRLLVDLGHFR